MHKSRTDVEDDFGDFPFLNDEADHLDLGNAGHLGQEGGESHLPARRRLEMRNEQRSLREQLSDWDDYNEDFDTDL